MKKTFLNQLLQITLLLSFSGSAFSQELPGECKTFLAEAEKMFKLIELDAKLIENELNQYQRDMQKIELIKLPKMCSDAIEAIKEQLPELTEQMEQIKALKQAAESPNK